MSEIPISIKGGAGPLEAAAIAAVIQQVLEREQAARAEPPRRSRQTAWVRAVRSPAMVTPTTASTRFARWAVEPES